MYKFLAILLILIFFSAGSIISNHSVSGQSQNSYSVQLQGFVWNHSTLNALVVTAGNESWWNPIYTNDTLRAISQWNEALWDFAANYSDYAYLSNLVINAEISNEPLPDYDLYINWTKSPMSDATDEVGLAKTYAHGDKTIINCSISLATHTNHGSALSEVDMQSIALHELGHGLGLGHSNYTGDLMYSYYTLGGYVKEVSTLDAYGVGTLFAWMPNSSNFYPIRGWLKENAVSLPSQITYQNLPVSQHNSPPITLSDNQFTQFFVYMFEVLLHPEIAVPIAIIIAVLVIIAVIPRRRKPQDIRADS